jgi:hypothetical protein
MCTCASCKHTDSFAKAGFAEWPRGAPAGPRRSAADYSAHVRHGQQWGRGYDGTMHEPKECTATLAYYQGSRAAPERLKIPEGRWQQGHGYHDERKWIEAPTTMREYVAEFERLNGLTHAPVEKPTAPLIARAQLLRAEARAERKATLEWAKQLRAA